MDDDEKDAWDRLTAEGLASMRSLSAAKVAEADSMLLSMCTQDWQKVARVVGQLLDAFDRRFPRVPFEFLTGKSEAVPAIGPQPPS